MDSTPIVIKNNKHFKMLAVLIIALSVIQTVILDARRVSHQDLRMQADSIVAITTAVTNYQSARTRHVLKTEINNLDAAIFENVLVPLQDIDKRLNRLDSSTHKNAARNEILLNYQLLRIKQIIDRSDSINKWYLEDRIRF